MRRRRVASIAASLALSGVLLGGGVAHAEGSWNSSIENWLTGLSSRSWSDKNTDATRTTVTFKGCHYDVLPKGPSHVSVEVMQNVSFGPDKYRGQKKLYCAVSGSADWGDMTKASYHFVLRKIDGTERSNDFLDVTSVVVKY